MTSTMKVHDTALRNGQAFFETYLPALEGLGRSSLKVADIGSYSVNGSLRDVCPTRHEYIGVDLAAGPGVDVVMTDPYRIPLDDASVDVVVSSSCYEHAEFFWILQLEIMRVLRPHGLFYLNAPSAGSFHRYPVDCWRFYPDSGKALERWGMRNSFDCVLLESSTQVGGNWNDFVAVFLRDRNHLGQFPESMAEGRLDAENIHLFGVAEISNYQKRTQAMRRLDSQGRFSKTFRETAGRLSLLVLGRD